MHIPASAPPSAHHLQSDHFCPTCHYNLHGQPVTVDERLQIPVCTCPECGRILAVGGFTTAAQPWFNRLITAMLALWALAVIAMVFLAVFCFGALQNLHLEVFTYNRMAAPDGRTVEWGVNKAGVSGPVYAGTNEPAPRWRYVRSFIPNDQLEHRDNPAPFIVFFSVALGFLFGMFAVVFLWHWGRSRYRILAIAPFLAAGFVIFILLYDRDYADLTNWAVSRVLAYAGVQSAAVLLGVGLGRPLARVLVRAVVPPKPRQHLAFLWLADGHALPPLRSARL